tara:strand:+ start:941 stop:1675 length:735 start_codon:yes stop_codon:yes gene_type:complete
MNEFNSNFGYTKVTSKEKTKLVQDIFTNVSKKYDLMNDLMSLGTHRLWKKEFVNVINPSNHEKIIDVGSGTGDIAKNILKTNFKGELHLLDLNIEMLNIGKRTINKNKKIFFHQSNAEKTNFEKNYFDKYIIAFCLRNITNIEKSMKEALRILKPGGIYFSLEFSTPNSALISKLYSNYRNKVLPYIGEKVTNNKNAYKYLNESIALFPNQKKIQLTLEKIGFKNVSYINLFDGIVTIHKGYKI